MSWFSTIFFWVVMIGFAVLVLASMIDDDEKKKGIQKRKYYNGKAGLKYKAPGDGEKLVLGILVVVLWTFVIIGVLLNV